MVEQDGSKWLDMRVKHMEFLQSAISRMSNTSSSLKNLTMSIFAAVVALSVGFNKPIILLFCIPVELIFWFLDSRYLLLEQGFRRKYDSVRKSSINTMPDFDMQPLKEGSSVTPVLNWSVATFYLSLALVKFFIYLATSSGSVI